MAKICIIGDYDSICGFKALGIDTFAETDAEKAENLIEELIEKNYVIILITENIAVQIIKVLDKYRTQAYPAIIPVPSISGTQNLGISYLRKAVEQAVGSADMIFGADE